MKLLILAIGAIAAFLQPTQSVTNFDELSKKLPLQSASEKAFAWMMSKRQEDWGWGSVTPDAIIAIQLANDSWLSRTNLESQLSVKQLQLETALALWSRHHENPIRPGRVAKMVNALVSVCEEPKSFYGHDLVTMLEHLDTSHPFEYTYVMMTLCNAGVHVRKKQIRRLFSFIDEEDSHNHDTLALTVLAMSCLLREHHNRNLLNYLRKPIKRLKKMQHEDGGFGNIHTSALAAQALVASGNEEHTDWNATRAFEYLLSQQQSDGSFGNLMATVAVLPVLAGRSYSHIANTSCRAGVLAGAVGDEVALAPSNAIASNDILPVRVSSGGASTSPTPAEPKMIGVKYSLWIGNNITENHTLSITVPANTSFYEIMKRAAEENEKFEFSASLWPNGHYVHTLAGLKEDRVENLYWLLCLNQNGPENPIFVDTGVDDFYPQDGETMSFWYKKI